MYSIRLMALHRAQLNMNKPSSADTPAKPNSAYRHHCRTEQEAPDSSLACTNELQWLRRHAIKSFFQSQLPIKRNIMALNNPAVVFSPLSLPFSLPILAHCCDKRCNRDHPELRERGGTLSKWVFRGGDSGVKLDSWSRAACSLRALCSWRWLDMMCVW